jgi:hypothetical protein
MLTMHTHPSDSTDERNAVIACVLACFVLLACLVIADKLFGADQSADHIRMSASTLVSVVLGG